MPRLRPESLLDQPIPDLTLPTSNADAFPLRSRVGVGPLVLFFYVRNASPG